MKGKAGAPSPGQAWQSLFSTSYVWMGNWPGADKSSHDCNPRPGSGSGGGGGGGGGSIVVYDLMSFRGCQRSYIVF
jgi:hypothetical protein